MGNTLFVESAPEAGPTFVKLGYLRREAYSGLTYSLWHSADLSTWSAVPTDAVSLVPGYPKSLNNGIELIHLYINKPAPADAVAQTFYRIEVQ
jgi:hypothetical protein